MKKLNEVIFNWYPASGVTENSRYEFSLTAAVLFKFEEFKTFDAAIHVIVFLEMTVPEAFVATVGRFPGVGQAETPVKTLE